MSAARDELLGRVRAALRDAPPAPAVTRAYRRTSSAGREELVALFAERTGEYRAVVERVPRGEIADAAARALAAHGALRVVVPPDLPREWRPEGVELIEDRDLPHAELDAADGVLTGSATAIAETGTIVLDAGPGQGRRAITLVPDLHVCVVDAAAIVGLVPEAFARVDHRRPVTLVSGPSATSDIELSRVEGVHGPRRLHVLIAG